MKRLIMEVRKRDAGTGEMNLRRFDLTPLADILEPKEIFSMEHALNLHVPTIRVHLSLNDDLTLCTMGQDNAEPR